jgi:hypothetical protein
MKLTRVCRGYLCSPDANIYDIDFTRFRIRDTESSRVLFEVTKPPGAALPSFSTGETSTTETTLQEEHQCRKRRSRTTDQGTDQGRRSSSEEDEREEDAEDINLEERNACRFVRYQFPSDFLQLKTVGATIEFTVGSKAIKKFRMIERHFFRDTLLKNFDFEFGFCIPNSSNSCEHIYDFPNLSNQMSEFYLVLDLITY